MNNALLKQEIPEAIAATKLAQCQDEKERFRVTGKDSANWCLRKIRALKAEIKDNARIAQEEVERIQEWLKNVNEPLENSISYFEGLLEAYHREVYEGDPKLKTIKLPHGTLKLRTQQPEFIRDDEKLLQWLKQNGMNKFVKVIEKPEWGELKKKTQVVGDKVVLVDTGEVIEGVTAEQRPPKFSVEVG